MPSWELIFRPLIQRESRNTDAHIDNSLYTFLLPAHLDSTINNLNRNKVGKSKMVVNKMSFQKSFFLFIKAVEVSTNIESFFSSGYLCLFSPCPQCFCSSGPTRLRKSSSILPWWAGQVRLPVWSEGWLHQQQLRTSREQGRLLCTGRIFRQSAWRSSSEGRSQILLIKTLIDTFQVTYTVNGDGGYVADVQYTGEAQYPPEPAGGYGKAKV